MSPIDRLGAALSFTLAAATFAATAFATTSAPPPPAAVGDDIFIVFDRISAAWASGNGLALVFFLALGLFFTGRVFTGRERERLEKQMAKLDADWQKRYEENDRRWERQLDEVKNRSATQEQLLYQMMGMQREATMVARQATNMAQASVTSGNATPPPQPKVGP